MVVTPRSSIMFFAIISINIFILFNTSSAIKHFYLGHYQDYYLFIPLAPILGLLLGLLDISLTSIILQRREETLSKYESNLIAALQNEYVGKERFGIVLSIINSFGEEAIRGVVFLFMYSFFFPKNATVNILSVALMINFSRPLPLWARLPKMLDDVVLTVCFYLFGWIFTGLMHFTMNTYIIYPLLFENASKEGEEIART